MSDKKHDDIPKRLKAARCSAGFKSSRAFALQHSFPETTYLQHESGKRKLHVDSLLSYSVCLNINPSWLLCGEGFPTELPAKNEEILEYLFINGYEKASLPELEKSKICSIDIEILTDILKAVIDIVTKNQVNMCCDELVEFTYSVYNNIIHSDSDSLARKNLIELATNSLVQGNQSKPQAKAQ